MTSQLAWLDFSPVEQRRARELMQLFSQTDSRDELGLGVVRDVFSDALFPGISTVQTRTRYFLFVPWIAREAEALGKTGLKYLAWVERKERDLVESLRSGRDLNGLIGRNKGKAVKILPSTIYWNGLLDFGILRRNTSLEGLAGVGRRRRANELDSVVTEIVEAGSSTWHESLPPAPDGFFAMDSCDFELSHAEADWLKDRILETTPTSLLAHYITIGAEPDAAASTPWEDPAAGGAHGDLGRVVGEARRFSVSMHGAALLYNVMVAERCAQLGRTDLDDAFDGHRERFDEWVAGLGDPSLGLERWDLVEFWRWVAARGGSVRPHQHGFITAWIEAIRTASDIDQGDPTLRRLVRRQERDQKRQQARLTNDGLARRWGGASGDHQLDYRWPQARRQLTDIMDGLART